MIRSVLTALLLLAGCASVEMENISPTQSVPSVPGFETIETSVLVRTSDAVVADKVGQALLAAKVFKEVVYEEEDSHDLTLVFSSTVVEDDHFGAELWLAVGRGVLFGLADGACSDDHDCTVTTKSILKRDETTLGQYEAVGSFHSEIPEPQPSHVKIAHHRKTVENSWNHALALLIAQIKRDRARIVAAGGN